MIKPLRRVGRPRSNGALSVLGAMKYVVMIAALVGGRHGDLERAVRLLAAVDAWRDWGEVVSPTHHDPAAYAALQTRTRRGRGDPARAAPS
jgi:hypothetical protein